VGFGDVVENCAETCDPEEAGLERYVAMEHLEPGSLHVRSWGNVADGTTFTRRCRPGQVLFGKRRAYQRKVAVSEFEAVVSGDIYVLAPKAPQRLLPELLPFLCLSERFFQHAVGTSAGSLSPRTNWSSLASFEFDLPPLDQQRRIAEILWAVNEEIQTGEQLVASILNARDRFFDDELRKSETRSPETMKNLGAALVRIVAGKSPKASSAPAAKGEYGVLKVSAAGDGRYVESENKALLSASDFEPSLEVKPGMILVTRCNAVLSGIGRACLVERTRPGLMLSDKTLELVPNEYEADTGFLLQGLRSEPYRGFVERSANGTEAKNVSQETLKASPFWLPPIEVQRRVSSRLTEFVEAADVASLNLRNQTQIRTAITNTVVS
jgi:type I restriction enzyme S subunit